MAQDNPTNSRLLLGALICTGFAVLRLSMWHHLKVATIPIWIDMSIFVMPLLDGLMLGWVARSWSYGASIQLAAFVALLTFLTGVAGGAMEYRVSMEARLKHRAQETYLYTMAYAKLTTETRNDKELVRALESNRYTVIGRLAGATNTMPVGDYWTTRNALLMHWLVLPRNSLTDRVLFRATRVHEDPLRFDKLVTRRSLEPLPSGELERFKEQELPHLRDLAAGRISEAEFSQKLIRAIEPRIPAAGFDMFLVGFLVLGSLCAFKVAYRSND